MNRQELFKKIIEDKLITILFQPIVNLKTGEIIGYEALSRGPADTELYSPLALIKTATELNKLCELEMLFKAKALERAAELGIDKLLFLNVAPSVINDNNFTSCMTVSFIKKHGIPSDSIVIELTEKTAEISVEDFKNNVEKYQGTGINLAYEGGSSGFSSFFNSSQVSPKFIKIDQSLIRNVNEDMTKISVLNAFVTLSHARNIKLVAEGIETIEELKALLKLRIFAGQGYFLAKPTENPSGIDIHAREVIAQYARHLKGTSASQIQYIGNICKSVPALDATTPSIDVRNKMEKHHYEGICVLFNNNVSGLIMKNWLDARLSSQEGFLQYANRPVRGIMDTHCIVVDYYTSINAVSDLVLTRPRENSYDNVIVTKNSSYYGMVTMIDLLKYAMQIQYNLALNCNPLTQLPGNKQINDRLTEIIQSGDTTCVLYLDLNHFKAYNDVYGFGRGDTVIIMTRNVISSVIESHNDIETFIGHIGGDDFVICAKCHMKTCEQICDEIISKFNLAVVYYYNEQDRNSGHIITESRNHHIKSYPLTQVSIGGLHGHFEHFEKPEELAQYIGKLKKSAKDSKTSAYAIEDLSTGEIHSNSESI